MKIVGVETVRIDAFPNLLFVRVESSDGLFGLGETYYGARAVESYIHETAAERLLGEKLDVVESLHSRLAGYVGRGGSGAETRGTSALDIALWDLHAKHRQTTLRQLFGNPADSIGVYNTCAGPQYVRSGSHQESASWGLPSAGQRRGYQDLELAMTDAGILAKDLLDQGITAMKIWPFDRAAERSHGTGISDTELITAMEPLAKIRSAVGDQMQIKVELHGLWRAPAIDGILEALQPFHPAWVEDPLPSLDVWGYERLTSSTPLAIATGETLAGTHAYRHLCERRATDVVICDVGWCGGVTTALEVAALVDEYDLALAFHDCTGPVGLAVATNLSTVLPRVAIQEFTRSFYSGWYGELATGLPTFADGRLTPRSGFGHGVELLPDLLARPGVSVVRSAVPGR